MEPSSVPLRANVELKARLDDPAAAVAVCRRLGAADQGEERQTDTYFSLGRYRLKLRESTTGRHWLIGYSRPDRAEARKSQYRLTPVPNPAALKATLARQWGIKAVVSKRRRVFLWEGRVRIHVDDVEGLGTYLEFEAVLDPARPEYDEAAATLDVARLVHDFGLAPRDLVAESYSTLVHASHAAPAGT
jgi:predicted adenylyl cyclase CyaB